ncbi:MAG TPA: CHAT domain-containing protein, partial [Anaerolineae bacterium]|nr:CHAT domain-containing protein [Anaerolineae bacterium]
MVETELLELIVRFTRPKGASPKTRPTVTIHAPGLGVDTPAFRFTPPLGDKELAEIRWYLETYWRWPVGPDYDRAKALEANLEAWGRRLFASLFAQGDARDVYRQFEMEPAAARLLTIDAVEPDILRLPWELLADEDGYLWSLDPPIAVRRRLHKVKRARRPSFTLPLRLLMVVSRPDGVGFLDPRSSAEALLDALEPLGERVVVEFLRPPTLKALTDRLGDRSQPPVHVVHFDGHGVYQADTGLGYLVFEDANHKEDLVDANRLGTLLNRRRIPLMVLDACQTAKPDESNPFGSVAARLIQSGVGSVLAMNYSVLVPTTRRLTSAFYRTLAAGATVGQAVDAARYELLADTFRLSLYREGREEAIHLQDWFLPALYQQMDDPAPFKSDLTGLSRPVRSVEPPAWRRLPLQPARGGLPPEPAYGFYGRARELLALERLFADRAVVVLHGYGGQGKTALAGHAARWLVRTGLFETAVFASFEGGGGLEAVVSEFGHALVGDDFAIHEGDPVDAIAQATQARPTLLIWDNFESILPRGDLSLPDDELQRLLAAGLRWATNGSRLLITSRDPDLPPPAYRPSARAARLELGGLSAAEALELAAGVLEAHNLPRPPREDLSRLLHFLGGHPLSLQLVLPHLRGHTVAELIAEFERLLPGFTAGAGRERNQSLLVSLDFSLRRLSDEARAHLPDLAVFQGGAWEPMILAIGDWDEAAWRDVRAELQNAALLSAEELPGVSVPFLRFHPTLLPYLADSLPAERRAELETRYRRAYHELATFLYTSDPKNPIQARAIAAREMPNLRRALDLTLAASEAEVASELGEIICKFLDVFGRWR